MQPIEMRMVNAKMALDMAGVPREGRRGRLGVQAWGELRVMLARWNDWSIGGLVREAPEGERLTPERLFGVTWALDEGLAPDGVVVEQ